MYDLENAYSVEQENSLCAKLENSVDAFSPQFSPEIHVLVVTDTRQILALYSQTSDVFS